MNRFRLLYTAILLLSLQFASWGQVQLTLEKCRNMALENSHDLKIARENIKKADAQKDIARANYLPKVSGSAIIAYRPEDYKSDLYMPTVVPDMTTGELVPNVMVNPMDGQPVVGADGNPVFNTYAWIPLELSLKGAYMAGVSLEQAIYAGGKILAGNNMAKIGKEMAGENLRLQNMNVISEADQAYWIHISVKEKVKLVAKSIEMLSKVVETVQGSYDAGMVNKNDLLKVQVQYNKAKLDLQKARSGLALTRMSLCRIIGEDYNTAIVVSDSVITYSNQYINDRKGYAVIERPEYKLLEKSLELEEENIKLVKGDYLPTAGVSVGYNFIGGIELSGEEIKNNGLNVMASLNIPIFNWGEGKKKIEVAKADREIKKIELNKNMQLMILEIEQARLNMQDAYSRIEIVNQSLQQAEENLKVNQDNYDLGMGLMTDLLMAQTSWQQIYSELIDAKTDFKIKETAYLKAVGNLK